MQQPRLYLSLKKAFSTGCVLILIFMPSLHKFISDSVFPPHEPGTSACFIPSAPPNLGSQVSMGKPPTGTRRHRRDTGAHSNPLSGADYFIRSALFLFLLAFPIGPAQGAACRRSFDDVPAVFAKKAARIGGLFCRHDIGYCVGSFLFALWRKSWA